MPPTIKKSRRTISILVGVISIAVVLAIYLLKDNVSDNLNLALRILFAIGCGGLSAALIGFITLNYNASGSISAGGGLAVFVLIYFFPPFGFGQNDYSSSIFLKNSQTGNSIESSKIELKVRLDENLKLGEYIPSSNTFLFKPIPINYLDKEVELFINSPKWVFENDKNTIPVILTKGKIDITIKRDSLSLLVKANVTDSLLNPVKNAKISVVDDGSLNSSTDDNGNFVISFPTSYNSEIVRLRITADGFRTKEDIFKLGESNSITLYR